MLCAHCLSILPSHPPPFLPATGVVKMRRGEVAKAMWELDAFATLARQFASYSRQIRARAERVNDATGTAVAAACRRIEQACADHTTEVRRRATRSAAAVQRSCRRCAGICICAGVLSLGSAAARPPPTARLPGERRRRRRCSSPWRKARLDRCLCRRGSACWWSPCCTTSSHGTWTRCV